MKAGHRTAPQSNVSILIFCGVISLPPGFTCTLVEINEIVTTGNLIIIIRSSEAASTPTGWERRLHQITVISSRNEIHLLNGVI